MRKLFVVDRVPVLEGVTRWERRRLAAVLGIGLMVQVACVLLLADVDGGGGWDSLEYSRHARSLLEAGVYSNDGVTPNRMRQPLYPLFLAAVYWLSGDGNPAVYVVQVLINTASIGLTWWLSRWLGGSPGGALTGALILALYPPFARLGGMILTESLSTLLWLVTAGLFVRCVVRPDAWGALGLGAVIGLHTLCRSSTAALPLVLAPMLWYATGRGRRAASATLLAALAFAVVVLPWGIRNAVTLGTPTILSSEGGATLFFGTHPEWAAIWSAPGGETAFVESERMRALIGDEHYLSEKADARLRAEGLRQLAKHPGSTLFRGAVGVARTWLYMPGSLTVTRGRPWLWIPVVAVPVGLLALALGSLLQRRARLLTVVLLGFPGYMSGVLVLASAHPRLVLPLFPFVAIGAGLAVEGMVAACLARCRARPVHESPGPGEGTLGARVVADDATTRQRSGAAREASRLAASDGL